MPRATALALRPRQQDGASRAQGRVKLQTTPILDIFLLAHPPHSVASLPPVTTSLPGMQALPESCGRAGLASEAIIKLQSSVTPRSKHVRQERCCGSSSAEWLETDISDGTSQRDEVALQRAPMTYVALQRTTVITGCRDCEVSAMLRGIYFIYLPYYFNSFLLLLLQMESVSLSGNKGYSLQARSEGGWATQFSPGHASKRFAEMCEATHL